MFDCRSQVIQKIFILLCGTLHLQSTQLNCLLINVYAPNDSSERSLVFNSLISATSSISEPILMGGDFNIVRNAKERLGVSLKRSDMKKFSEFVDSLGLIDLPLHGGLFTWSNLRKRRFHE
ncbi:hypothetical protein V6N13_096351 [Hibiscus sabdariffa]